MNEGDSEADDAYGLAVHLHTHLWDYLTNTQEYLDIDTCTQFLVLQGMDW
jgi:hypothetical protein